MKTRIAVAVLTVILGILVCSGQTAPPAPSVTLAWDVTTDTNVVSYNIYYGSVSRAYTNTFSVGPRTNSTATVTGLKRGVTYYFAATAMDWRGLESDLSTEVSYTTATLPARPVNLSVTTKTP